MKNREDATIRRALKILETRLHQPGAAITSPAQTIDFLKLNVAHLEHEVFGVLFLDNRHAMIRFDAMFRGTIDGAAVYPREVAKAALSCNAAAVILVHNHPSGMAEPSNADQRIPIAFAKRWRSSISASLII